MIPFFNSLRLSVLDFISKERSDRFVFRYQLILSFSSLILLSYFLAIPFIGQDKISYSSSDPSAEFVLGKKAPRSIVAPRDMEYEDKGQTRARQEQILENSPRIFVRDYSLLQNHIRQTRITFKEFSKNKFKLKAKTDSEAAPVVQQIKENKDLKMLLFLSLEDMRFLQQKQTLQNVQKETVKILKTIYRDFVIIPPATELLEKSIFGNALLHTENSPRVEKPVKADPNHIFTVEELFQTTPYKTVTRHLRSKSAISNREFEMARRLAFDLIVATPMVEFSPRLTELEKEKRLEDIDRVELSIPAGKFLVIQGATVTELTLWKLEAYNRILSSTNVASIASILLMQAMLFFVLLITLRNFGYDKLNSVSTNSIIFSLLWFLALATFGIQVWYYGQGTIPVSGKDLLPPEIFHLGMLTPTPVLSIVLAIIFGKTISFVMGLYLAFFVFVASKFDPFSFLMVFTTSILIAFTGEKITKRIHFFQSGLYVFICQTVILVAALLHLEKDGENFWFTILTNLGVSFLWSFISFGILTLYEFIFNIPTNFRLLELADRDNPLLQKIAKEAPSTFQHTMMVASLSETAVRALGGNALLTRVGCYYHDIGKTKNAGFYIENQHLIPKPEQAALMTPKEASKIIIDHVLDGIDMARSAQLPKEIIDFIPQHHGTSTMAYFYHKALREKKDAGEINRKDFRYPGPIPQSKETAVVMLADSLEAASRSLPDPTSDQLNELIKRIIQIKLDEGQLLESNLTLGDLEVVRQSFLDSLLSMLHSRPRYPSTESIKKLEKKDQKEKEENQAQNNSSTKGQTEEAQPAVEKNTAPAKKKSKTTAKTKTKKTKPKIKPAAPAGETETGNKKKSASTDDKQ